MFSRKLVMWVQFVWLMAAKLQSPDHKTVFVIMSGTTLLDHHTHNYLLRAINQIAVLTL